MTEALNSSIGAHPNTRSESNKTYWKSITGAAVTGRTIELSTVAQTPKVTDTFTPLFDQGSFMDRAATFARRLAKPALATGGATAAVAGTAIVVDLDGNYASAQEPSVVPTPEPSVEPSIEPTPTDPLTGLPCVPGTQPTPEPSESIIPDRTLPPDIGKVSNGEALALTGADVFVSSEAQAEPSVAPSGAPSTAPESPAPTDPTTAVNCDTVLKEAYLKAGKPADKELVKFSFMDEAIEAPISMGELKGIIKAFYSKYPEALQYVDEYDTKLTTKIRNRLLKQCEKGYPDDPKPVIEQSRASSCAGLLKDFYYIARENKSQGMMELAQAVYWYALADLKAPDPEWLIGKFLGGIEIKKQVIQG